MGANFTRKQRLLHSLLEVASKGSFWQITYFFHNAIRKIQSLWYSERHIETPIFFSQLLHRCIMNEVQGPQGARNTLEWTWWSRRIFPELWKVPMFILGGYFLVTKKPIKNRSVQTVFDRSLFILIKDPMAHPLHWIPLFTGILGNTLFFCFKSTKFW